MNQTQPLADLLDQQVAVAENQEIGDPLAAHPHPRHAGVGAVYRRDESPLAESSRAVVEALQAGPRQLSDVVRLPVDYSTHGTLGAPNVADARPPLVGDMQPLARQSDR